jgi:hypothetical protein
MIVTEIRRGPGRPPKLIGQEQAVIESYLAGATLGEVAMKFGVGEGPVVRILDDAGIERRRGRPSGRAPSAPRDRPTEAGGSTLRKVPKRRPTKKAPMTVEQAVRSQVLERDGFRCRHCRSRNRLTVEYAIEPAQGGSPLNVSDLRTTCAACATSPVKPAPQGILRRILGR